MSNRHRLEITCFHSALVLADALAERHEQAHVLALLDREGHVRRLETFGENPRGLLEYGDCLSTNDPDVVAMILFSVGLPDVTTVASADLDLFLTWTATPFVPLLDWIQVDADNLRSLAVAADPDGAWAPGHNCEIGELLRQKANGPISVADLAAAFGDGGR